MRKRLQRIARCTSFALISAAPIAPATAQEGTAAALVARTLGPTPILADLQELTDTLGGRPTGSPALDQAVEWGAAKLRAAGLENVRTEEYAAGGVWVPISESGEVVAPRHAWQPAWANQLRVAAMPFSKPTPVDGLEA